MQFWRNLFGLKTEQRSEPETQPEQTGTGIEALLAAQASNAPIVVTKKEALNIPAVSSSVDLIASAIASLPVKLYKEVEGKRTEEVKGDPRVALLNDDTGAYLTGYALKYKLIEDFLLEGNGYAYINRKRNKVEKIHYVEPNVVSIMANSDPIFKKYEFKVQGKKYEEFDFIKVVRKTNNGMTGVGIIEENRKLLSVAYQTLIFEENLVADGGSKKGFLQSTKKLAQEAIDSLKLAWRKLYQNNSGENVVVLNEGIEFKEASITSVEMQLNENKKTNAGDIKSIFNINDGLDEKTISAAILPTISAFQAALNQDLLLPSEKEGSFYFAVDIKNLIKGDIEKRYNAYEKGVKNGWLQIDEVRYEEDLPPLNLNFIKLGLQDVLYDPKTGQIYTPNTNKTTTMSDNPSPENEDQDTSGGGENIEN